MTKPIYILNGPNLNRLGSREPEIYGSQTLADIEADCRTATDYDIVFLQSNIEGEIVGHIQEAADKACAVLINPAAYTHTSVAIYDALKLLDVPIVEIHLSQKFLSIRAASRHKSAKDSGLIDSLNQK